MLLESMYPTNDLGFLSEGPDSHDAAVSVLAFSPDGKWIASGSADSTIILWDAGSERQLLVHEWVAHVGGVDRLAFSPSDGQFLASSGKDNAVTIWAVGAEDGVDDAVARVVGGLVE